jgi:pyrroline-5-carboxylate reductase
VLLAVKPQDLAAVGADVQGKVPPSAVLVSIAAGVPLHAVERMSGHRSSVRVMPNLPAAIGEGAAVFYASPGVTEGQRRSVRAVLDAVATSVVEVHDDEAVDLATAIHGSGRSSRRCGWG